MPTFVRTRLPRLAWDAASWVIASAVVTGVVHWHLSPHQWAIVASYVVAASLLQVLVGLALKLYLGRYRLATFDENVGLAVVTGVVSVVLATFSVSLYGLESTAVALSVLCPPARAAVHGPGPGRLPDAPRPRTAPPHRPRASGSSSTAPATPARSWCGSSGRTVPRPTTWSGSSTTTGSSATW
ncbi:hypothetical protein [Georgenia sp. SUBG003]|uniref:hypothetical protein n=1 Tax=Georgenia sp. SUBG003 TaxID=1497974 RepID=UPI003AB12C26